MSTIPVNSIGGYAFAESPLDTIICLAATPPALYYYNGYSNVFNYNNLGAAPNIPVYVPCFAYNNYKNSAWGTYFTNFVINGAVSDTTYYSANFCYGTSYSDQNFTNKTAAGKYYITYPNTNNCDSVVCLTLTQLPYIPVTNYSAQICNGASYSDANFTNITQAGNHTVALPNINGCDSIVVLNLSYKISPVQNICMVSVDNSNHNQVVWQRAEKVASYNIYRESNVSGNYDFIANVPYNNQNTYTDMASNAKIRSYNYKAAAIDTCGNESALSTAHKTMHLTINAGQNNSWNLIWTPYEGVSFSTYNIYRAKNSPNNFELIGTMPAGNTSYTDFSPGGGNIYYMVEIVLNNACNISAPQNAPSHSPLRNVEETTNSIRSNIATNENESGIDEVWANQISVFPNPVKDELIIKSEELKISSVEIIDIAGKKIVNAQHLLDTQYLILDTNSLPHGVYFVKIYTDKGIITKKVVKN